MMDIQADEKTFGPNSSVALSIFSQCFLAMNLMPFTDATLRHI
jgi:hypothetical protein